MMMIKQKGNLTFKARHMTINHSDGHNWCLPFLDPIPLSLLKKMLSVLFLFLSLLLSVSAFHGFSQRMRSGMNLEMVRFCFIAWDDFEKQIAIWITEYERLYLIKS